MPTDQAIPLDRQYTNDRFAFSIRYPDVWAAVESQNGDGVKIDTGNDSQQVRANEANYMSEFSGPYDRVQKEGFTFREIMLDSGGRQ